MRPAAALRGDREHSLNVRGACPNMRGADLKVLWGSIAIISAAIVITFTGYTRADSLASIPIFGDDHPSGAWSLLRDVVDVIAAPASDGAPGGGRTRTRVHQRRHTAVPRPGKVQPKLFAQVA